MQLRVPIVGKWQQWLCATVLSLGQAAPALAKDLPKELQSIAKAVRGSSMAPAEAWIAIDKLSAANLAAHRQVIAELKALILTKAGYPVLAASYAAEAIELADDSYGSEQARVWKILAKASRQVPVQYVTEDLALSLDKKNSAGALPPEFGNDWAYIRANAAVTKGNDKAALELFKKLKMSDRYFLPAQYQVAMILISMKREDEALVALNAILNPASQQLSSLPASDRRQINNYTRLALGRLHYQRGNFVDSVKNYRRVDKESTLFYDALFEQSWSLFMGGYPAHSLGSLHGAASPFFNDRFNPEVKVLEAIENYWMCLYDESKNSLADFAENSADEIEALSKFLGRQRLSSATAYTLFENMVTGVSSEALGLPQNILRTAAGKDTMLLLRDQFATLIAERSRLEQQGLEGDRRASSEALRRADAHLKELRESLGEQFLVELKGLKESFDELYAQSQFLYLELLMSEKEHILGRELHSESKLTALADDVEIKGWAKQTQLWKAGQGDEYWWDEVGFYIYPAKPACNDK